MTAFWIRRERKIMCSGQRTVRSNREKKRPCPLYWKFFLHTGIKRCLLRKDFPETGHRQFS